MTAAIVGLFLLHHFDAPWAWYAAVLGMAGLEIYHQDRFRNKVMDTLGELRYAFRDRIDRD